VTPEALAKLMSQNGETMAIFSSEGEPFAILAGRYSDNIPNLDLHLKAYSGDDHIVNRVKADPIHLRSPRLTMVMTVQPTVIAGLASKPAFRGRGLIGRVQFSMPDSRVGTRKPNPPEIAETIRTTYKTAVTNLLSQFDIEKPDEICMLTMSKEADAGRTKFFEEIEIRLAPGADLADVSDWAGKVCGLAARIAALLHLAKHALDLSGIPSMPTEVEGETYSKATKIARYFTEHALGAFLLMESDAHEKLARQIWKRIEKTFIERWNKDKVYDDFTAESVRRGLHVKPDDFLSGPEKVEKAIERLTERGLVRPSKKEPVGKPKGRPGSPAYEINPKAIAVKHPGLREALERAAAETARRRARAAPAT
jgi:hypothetical protein